MIRCNVCGSKDTRALYRSHSENSITTMNVTIKGETEVFVCNGCSHVQTKPLVNLKKFYELEYEINSASLLHDQLYKIENGKKIYRNHHQSITIGNKMRMASLNRVLDYGCGNGLTLKYLKDHHPNLQCFAFDVTDRYGSLWKSFLPKENTAANIIPPSWENSMDLVVSFFALEHVDEPQKFISNLTKYINENGTIYLVVPNMYENFADLLVADHINHFSHLSLYRLFEKIGFKEIEIDAKSHNAAIICKASKLNRSSVKTLPKNLNLKTYLSDAHKIAKFWEKIVEDLKSNWELNRNADHIIYGAGVYGSLIYQYLSQWGKVRCFIDRNHYVQGKHVSGLSILSPDEVDISGSNIWFGINPSIATDLAVDFIANRPVNSYYCLGT